MPNQRIVNDQGSYFHILLNMADDDLDPYEYRLLGHYSRVGTCWESVRTTAAKCRMSAAKVLSTRLALEAKGYISLQPRPKETALVTVLDRMAENVIRFKKPPTTSAAQAGMRLPDKQGVYEVNTDVHVVNTDVHEANERITSEQEPKQEPVKNVAPPGGAMIAPQPEEQPEREIAAAKDTEPHPPGPAAPLPPAAIEGERQVQPHVAIINGWMAGHNTTPTNFQIHRNVRVAMALVKDGFTPEQIEQCVRDLRKGYWAERTVPLEFVANQLPAWLADRGQRKAPPTVAAPAPSSRIINAPALDLPPAPDPAEDVDEDPDTRAERILKMKDMIEGRHKKNLPPRTPEEHRAAIEKIKGVEPVKGAPKPQPPARGMFANPKPPPEQPEPPKSGPLPPRSSGLFGGRQ